MGVVTIACKNGRVFSACDEDYVDEDFLKQAGYYAIQGCVVNKTDNPVSFENVCGKCEHCQSLSHNYHGTDEEED